MKTGAAVLFEVDLDGPKEFEVLVIDDAKSASSR